MVYKTEDVMYGYKAVYVCKKDESENSYQLLRIPECINTIYAIIKIEIPEGTTVVDPWGQTIHSDYHKLRCESAKFVEAVKYCYINVEEKTDELITNITNDDVLELKLNNTINTYLVEVSEKEVIDYNESKDIKYCSMYTFIDRLDNFFVNSFIDDTNILKPNDFMIAYPFLNTNDDLICASGIHFFKTEKEVYNYLLSFN